ncbi:Coq4 family protein [Archangium sp.]|uniref:Coq4 family protein n=1 Tax=Archangium sp. TaxID=1872627 RepID=UPI002D5AA537|nr:Coq4 family protein [Archangium sp.]HYO53323.1 Coq4 family protein [Archangium sp.]
MGIKYGQMLGAVGELLQKPFDPFSIGKFVDAVDDFWVVRRLYTQMVSGIEPGHEQRLRRLTQKVLDEKELLALPENTFGYRYAVHQRQRGYDINGELPGVPMVREVLARNWVFHRFVRLHDMMHFLLAFDSDPPGEAGLQLFDMLNFRDPYGALSMLGLPIIVYQYGQPPEILRELRRGWRLGRRTQNLLLAPLEDMLPWELEEVRRHLGIPARVG